MIQNHLINNFSSVSFPLLHSISFLPFFLFNTLFAPSLSAISSTFLSSPLYPNSLCSNAPQLSFAPLLPLASPLFLFHMFSPLSFPHLVSSLVSLLHTFLHLILFSLHFSTSFSYILLLSLPHLPLSLSITFFFCSHMIQIYIFINKILLYYIYLYYGGIQVADDLNTYRYF